MRFNQEYTPRTYYSLYTLKSPKFTQLKFGIKTKIVDEKTGEEKKAIDYVDAIGGYVIKVSPSEGEWEGNVIKNLEIHLCDGDGSHVEIIKTARYGSVARDIIKKLAHLEKIGFVKLNPWIYTPEDNPTMLAKLCSVQHILKYEGYLDDSHKVKVAKEDFEFPKAIPVIMDGEKILDNKGNQLYNTKLRDTAVDQMIELCSQKLLYKSVNEVKIAMNGGYSPQNQKAELIAIEEEGFDDEVPF